MINVARTDRTIIGSWWWTVDRMLLAVIAILALVGVVMIFAASPPVAQRRDLAEMHFVTRHLLFLGPAIVALIGTSLLAPRGVARLAVAMLGLFGGLTLLVPLIGEEIKGGQRWIDIGPLLVQPSEFVKPALVVVTAWLIARKEALGGVPAAAVPVFGFLALLAMQPDLGMSALVACVFAIQLFVAGIAWTWIVGLGALGIMSLWQAYLYFPHFARRVDRFLDPDSEVYQVERALSAVLSGGWLGRGPGEGVQKFNLPDAHADFIFAATAEEFGILSCVLIVGLFVLVVTRGLLRAQQATDRFTLLAACGLVAMLGLQVVIHMAVNLDMMPPKGMTLPFLSYGGSSLLALAIGTGMLLALTRKGARLEGM